MDGASLSEASKRLLRSDFGQAAVVSFLGALGSSVDADRAYVFEYGVDSSSGEVTASQRFEWNSGVSEPQIDNPELQQLPMKTTIPRWLEAFERRSSLWGLVRDFPQSEQDLLVPQDIVSILVCPILTHDEVWGFVGFDDCRSARIWSRDARRVLERASGALAAALRHRSLQQRLAVSREALRATVDALDSPNAGDNATAAGPE